MKTSLSLSASWTLLADQNQTDLRSAVKTAECEVATTCSLSEVGRELSVRLAGYLDHLNNSLTVLQTVKVRDVH